MAARREQALDVGIVALGVALTVLHAGSDPIPGPRWLVLALPLLLNVPMLWRRSRPLLVWSLVLAGVVLQAVVSGNSAEGLELIYAWGVGAYSVATYADRRGALAGLALAFAAYAIYAAENHDIQTGKASELWAGAFFALYMVACWLVGIFARSRREVAAHASRAAEIEREAGQAVFEERARMARELHDIVSHNLSVVVLQAAGARAQADPPTDPGTLEKIERSGREALVEMRRLLGVLRADGEDAALAPQPGLAQLDALVAGVRAHGLDIELIVDGACDGLPPALDLSAYRIVQEALTNTLKHAGHARARVRVSRGPDAVVIEVVDDGGGALAAAPSDGGHGLVGMRERVALFGGDLRAEPRPEGGFAVQARLPLAERAR
jgi:signal transduction histidine kinase